MKIICNFATENPKVGGFPLPVWMLKADCQSNLNFPNPNFDCESHLALGFHFPYSLKGFRNPFVKLSLFDNAKVRRFFHISSLFSEKIRIICI